MCSEATVKNTLAFVFPDDAAQPSLAEMARFIKSLAGDVAMMETTYKISDEKSVFIRYRNEDAMKFSLENNSNVIPFHYTNGTKVMVRMSVAGGNIRYVRVFDLLPEVSDQHITSVMAKYGKVKRTVRERFPAEFQLDMFTGVRGIYMDIEQDIPEVIYFHHRKARVCYDGRKTKCFVCKSETHMKKSCPVLQERRQKDGSHLEPTIEPQSVEATAAAGGGEADPHRWVVQRNRRSKQKAKKSETMPQRSAETTSTISSSASKEDSSHSATPSCGVSCVKTRCRVPTYEWFDDENERRELIESDRQRLAAAYNISVDEIEVYHN